MRIMLDRAIPADMVRELESGGWNLIEQQGLRWIERPEVNGRPQRVSRRVVERVCLALLKQGVQCSLAF